MPRQGTGREEELLCASAWCAGQYRASATAEALQTSVQMLHETPAFLSEVADISNRSA